MNTIEQYLSSLELRHYSPETIIKYRQVLSQFSLYCVENGIDLHGAAKADIREFRKFLKQRGLKGVSINGYTSVLKAFYEQLTKSLIDINPARGIPKQKEQDLLPSNIEESELTELLDRVDNDRTLSVSVMAMFEVLLGTGMRVSEMCSLELNDIEEWGRIPDPEYLDRFKERYPKKKTPKWIPGIIHIRFAKGSYQRKVPFPRLTELALKKYLQVRNHNNFTSPLLFCNQTGGMLNRGNVYKKIKPILDLTSSPKKGPHTLRHTYASHLINRGVDIATIRNLLGHKSVKTTQLYTHLANDALKRIHRAAHPKG